jgi:SAM-dependent methyltransferase
MKRRLPVGPPAKRYDEGYFRRWYEGRRAVASDAEVGRRARLAIAAAEYVLERRVRSVLDVGCGEGRWRAPLRRIRPGLVYVGVDPSEYVVRRHGRRRGIRQGSFGELGALRLGRAFDLVVCADVLHYVGSAELSRGLAAVRKLARGLVYADAFTSADDFEGDRDGWQPRSPRAYRRAFAAAGFVACGLNCWVAADLRDRVSSLERSD